MSVEESLKLEIASILSIDVSKVTLDEPLQALGMNSLSFVELLVRVEKVFKVNLMESGLTREDFQTIRSLASCIARSQ